MKSVNIIFLGRPGSGKGTQVALLGKKFSLKEIDTGSFLRELAKENSFLGRKIALTMKKGQLVPSWLVSFLWFQNIRDISVKKGLLFEGSPRAIEEAKIIEEALEWLGRRNFRAIYLNISEKEVKRRLIVRRICEDCQKEFSLALTPDIKKCTVCGGKLKRRPDDTSKAIEKRLSVFRKQILPVIDYFRKKRFLIEVDGEGRVEEVFQRIIKKLKA